MTALSDNEILLSIKVRRLVIQPFSREKLTPAGYDFSSATAFTLPPKQQRTIATTEHLELPNDILGIIHLKSSLCREALIGSFAIIDPGFRGNLTLSLFNSGESHIQINKNEPIIHVIFQKTGNPSSNPYQGKYQDSSGRVESKRKFEK
jgi:dCTP deaminase